MDETRSSLGKVTLLPISQIEVNQHKISIGDDKDDILFNLIRQYGQIKPIQVRQLTENSWEVFEGRQLFGALYRNCLTQGGDEQILAVNHGYITEEEALKTYYEIEALKTKFDVLESAKLFKKLSETQPLMSLIKNIDMDINELKDLIKLLEFDWDSMLNKKNNINQVSMFGDEA